MVAANANAQSTADILSSSAELIAGATPSGVLDAQKPFAALSASFSKMRDSVVAMARSQIGTRYRLGGETPGRELDCSALVRYVLSALQISLPRTARQQATVGEPVPKDLAKMKPGDLLTFGKGKRISHIGIYVGEGRMVHASITGKRVLETEITSRNPLIKQWKGVRRVVGTSEDSLRMLAQIVN